MSNSEPTGNSSSGADSKTRGPDLVYSDEELLDEVRRIGELLDRTPRKRDISEYGMCHPCTYDDRFGSWTTALKQAGFEANIHRSPSRNDLITDLKSVIDDMGESPRVVDYEDRGKYNRRSYYDEFGSWNDALEAASGDTRREMYISDERLLEHIGELASDLGRSPTANEMREAGQYSVQLYQTRFGTWGDAVEAAGYEVRSTPSGEDHPRWKGGEPKYGEGWTNAKKSRVRKRDGYECHGCGVPQERYVEFMGAKLDVHHIIPASHFDNDEDRNAMYNLVTLCRSCHLIAEHMAPLYPFGTISGR